MSLRWSGHDAPDVPARGIVEQGEKLIQPAAVVILWAVRDRSSGRGAMVAIAVVELAAEAAATDRQ